MWPALVGNKLQISVQLFEVLKAQANESRYIKSFEDSDVDTVCSEFESVDEECGDTVLDEDEQQSDVELEGVEDDDNDNDNDNDKRSENGNENGNENDNCKTNNNERQQLEEQDHAKISKKLRSLSIDVNQDQNQQNEHLTHKNDDGNGNCTDYNSNEQIPTPKTTPKRKLVMRKTSLASQIEQDLSRTFPDLAFFKEDGPFRQPLRDILESYSLLRPGLGYVQGMSFVAAMLLLFMEPDAAFICFCNILEDHMYFHIIRAQGKNSILDLQLQLFDQLLKEHLPKLFNHFASVGLRPEMYLIDWLLTILAKPLPLDVSARVWDAYLFYDTRDRKERFLWRAILGLLKLFESKLLLLDFDGLFLLLKNLPPFPIDSYFKCIKDITLTKRRVDAVRQKVGLDAIKSPNASLPKQH